GAHRGWFLHTIHLVSKGSEVSLWSVSLATISLPDTYMLQENISRRATSSGVRWSWVSDTICLLSKTSGICLWRNRVAMISSSDTSYEKKAGEIYHRLSGSRPGGLP